MGSLRDLLNKQKQGATNANTGGKVIQPAAVQKTGAQISQTVQQENHTTAGVSGSNQTATAENSNQAGSAVQQSGSAVVEQGLTMPEGLSLMQQVKWKKANAQKAPQTAKVEAKQEATRAEIPAGGNGVQNIKLEPVPAQPAGNVLNSSASASQTADAQKQNDGQVDTTALRANLEYLANNIEQQELVGQVVRTIATQLKQSPELTPFVSNSDMNLIVRGARFAYNIAARKKTEVKEAKGKAKGNADELNAMFKAAGFDGLKLNLK